MIHARADLDPDIFSLNTYKSRIISSREDLVVKRADSLSVPKLMDLQPWYLGLFVYCPISGIMYTSSTQVISLVAITYDSEVLALFVFIFSAVFSMFLLFQLYL